MQGGGSPQFDQRSNNLPYTIFVIVNGIIPGNYFELSEALLSVVTTNFQRLLWNLWYPPRAVGTITFKQLKCMRDQAKQ